MNHPENRAERFKRKQADAAVKAKEERKGRVWRKLTKERLREQETVDEIRIEA